uniref:Uncharacterized protein n=1 Tax=Pararge aegeria TaxID=116150 RepID=S4NV91_9NEOP
MFKVLCNLNEEFFFFCPYCTVTTLWQTFIIDFYDQFTKVTNAFSKSRIIGAYTFLQHSLCFYFYSYN